MPEDRVEEFSGNIAGQSFSLKSVTLNTLLTIAIGAGLIYLIVDFGGHAVTSKEQTKSVVQVLEKMEANQRIGNCLNMFPEHMRETKMESCRRTVGQ
jgi:hypothetical protein